MLLLNSQTAKIIIRHYLPIEFIQGAIIDVWNAKSPENSQKKEFFLVVVKISKKILWKMTKLNKPKMKPGINKWPAVQF